jgi:hypothetical protein
MITGAAAEVPLGAGALVRAGTLAAAGLVPIRCGAAGLATSAARALDGMRLLRGHARDRCLGLGVIGVQATT